jgi:protein TonB
MSHIQEIEVIFPPRVPVRVYLPPRPEITLTLPPPTVKFNAPSWARLRPKGEAIKPFSSAFVTDDTRPVGLRAGLSLSAVVVNLILVCIAVMAPLWFTNTLDLRKYTTTLIVGPPPAAPPAPYKTDAASSRAAAAPRPRSTFILKPGTLLLPRSIPKEVAMVDDGPAFVEPGAVFGGVPGGIPGGLLGDAFAGAVAAPPPPIPEPPPAAVGPKAPLQVGGHVQPPRAISTPAPVYPKLAQQARIQGDVLISAVIDVAGNVTQMKVVSGPPLLYAAALAALRNWKFEPTYLNGEPWPVSHEITIHFRM